MKLFKILTLALIPMASIAMDPAEIEASLQAGILPAGVTIVAVTAATGLAHDVALYDPAACGNLEISGDHGTRESTYTDRNGVIHTVIEHLE